MSAFPHLSPKESEIVEEEEETTYIYLYESSLPFFNLYLACLPYFKDGSYPEMILLKLIESRNLDLEDSLYLLPQIHNEVIKQPNAKET